MRRKFVEHRSLTQRGTQKRTQLGTQAQSGRRKRPLPYIPGSSDRLAERFVQILCEYEGDPRSRMYIYRASPDGYAIRPAIMKCHVFDHLEEFIRDRFGGGDYAIYVRLGETMLIAGIISIGVPRRRC